MIRSLEPVLFTGGVLLLLLLLLRGISKEEPLRLGVEERPAISEMVDPFRFEDGSVSSEDALRPLALSTRLLRKLPLLLRVVTSCCAAAAGGGADT
jgi:hypothetical protein